MVVVAGVRMGDETVSNDASVPVSEPESQIRTDTNGRRANGGHTLL